MKEVYSFLNNTLKKDDTIIISVSGGPDSMVLLDILLKLKIKLNIICAHVDHNVRKQSKKEYEYIKNYCSDNKIIFEGMEIVSKINNNFEAEARKIRYSFLSSLKNKYKAKYILTAHHGDDLIETILMRITRGSNLSGYIGLKQKENEFLRPLLLVTKKDIIEYAKQNNICYFIDKTNFKGDHTRNRYRKIVLPFLKKENKLVHKKYLGFSNELIEYNNFVNEYINNKSLIKDNKINIDNLKKETIFIQRKTVELLIKEIQKIDILDIHNKNIEDILKIINSKKSNLSVDLNNDYIATKNYDIFEIIKKQNNKDFNVVLENEFTNELFSIKKINDSDKKSNNIIRLNSNDIKLPIIIRNRKEKDVIDCKNLGHKKIKDIFIDKKINKLDRNLWPIITDSNDEVLWIPSLKKSKFDKEINEKYDIILACERKR